jgi:hypothetical protein
MSRYEFSIDPTAELAKIFIAQADSVWVEIGGDSVVVRLGEPPLFELAARLASIRSVDRVADLARPTRGVHGFRGKWLVNLSGDGLVRLRFRPKQEARFTLKADDIKGTKTRVASVER